MLSSFELANAIHMIRVSDTDSLPEECKRLARNKGLAISEIAGAASFYTKSYEQLDIDIPSMGIEREMFDFDNYAILELSADEIMNRLAESNIVGCGGSGFLVYNKWKTVAEQNADEKYVICNLCEGEGETYKDLKLLLRAPESIIEGVALCAQAVNAKKAIICIRYEYSFAKNYIEDAIAAAERIDVLNGLRIEVFDAVDTYVCGEETALLAAIEGKRAEPSLKPPYPSACGLFGKPTVINNAESFVAVASFLRSGKHTKLYTVTGCVKFPGVYETDYGIKVCELAKLSGASTQTRGFQLGGGATGAILSCSFFDIPLTFEACRAVGISLGTGSVSFFDNPNVVVSKAANCIKFLAEHSCGKCSPCRLGLPKLSSLLRKLKNHEATANDIIEISELSIYIASCSRCGFGQGAVVPVRTALNNFNEEFTCLEG